MDISALLKHYAAYDLWANRRYIDRLGQENDALLDQELASSFPSLRATILHIRNAEHTWLSRLKGVKYTWPAEADEDIDRLVVHCQLLHDHVEGMAEDEFTAQVSYADLRGNIHRQPAWELLMHCFNHSTQHRGQLITMMRALGLGNIPANDMVAYQRTLNATY